MKRIMYISGIVILAGTLVALFVFIKLYNKPHVDVSASTPDYIVSVENIVNDFKADEENANQKYLGKIVQMEGVIADVNTVNGNSVITLGVEGSSRAIICNMDASENKKAFRFQEGQKITVKGICTGFLLDVILVRAIIVN